MPDEKEKPENAYKKELQSEATKRLCNVKDFVKTMMDPGFYSFIEVVKVFRDGQLHSWHEIEEAVNISKVSLNKKLKEMTKHDVLKRYVIASFPPQTRYALNEEPLFKKIDEKTGKVISSLGKVSDGYKHIGQFLTETEQRAKTMIELGLTHSILIVKEEKTTDMENMVQYFIEDYKKRCLQLLPHFLRYPSETPWSSFPRAGELESWFGFSSLWNAAQTYSLLLFLGATVEVLRLHPNVKALANKLLETTLKTASINEVKNILDAGQDEGSP